MKKSKIIKIILINLRDLLIVIAVGLCISYFSTKSFKGIIDNWKNIALYSAIIGMTVWKGNVFFGVLFDKIYPWEKNQRLKVVLSVLVIVVYTTLSVIIVNLFWSYLFGEINLSYYTSSYFIKLTLLIIFVSIIIGSLMRVIQFGREKRETIIREEKKNMEILALRYETLKNQVNPHFLFNSLTALTTIVSDNNDAVKFIKKLSDVYRYVLESRERELIDLKSELKFAQSFIYLHKIRFGQSLNSESDIDVKNYMIVPLSLQMLVENAIKHNIVSEEMPLNIKIYIQKDNYLIVENNLQKKKNTTGSGIGLENIKSRYKYLSDKEFIIEEKNSKFIVKIPLIKTNNESINN